MQITITTPWERHTAAQAHHAVRLVDAILEDADELETIRIQLDEAWLTCYIVAGTQGTTELFKWDPNTSNPNGWAYWHSEWPTTLPEWAQP